MESIHDGRCHLQRMLQLITMFCLIICGLYDKRNSAFTPWIECSTCNFLLYASQSAAIIMPHSMFDQTSLCPDLARGRSLALPAYWINYHWVGTSGVAGHRFPHVARKPFSSLFSFPISFRLFFLLLAAMRSWNSARDLVLSSQRDPGQSRKRKSIFCIFRAQRMCLYGGKDFCCTKISN